MYTVVHKNIGWALALWRFLSFPFQEELEQLNSTSEEINTLEKELEVSQNVQLTAIALLKLYYTHRSYVSLHIADTVIYNLYLLMIICN